MPWESSPKGWYAFARGSYITLKMGPKYWNAEVSVYKEDAADGLHKRAKFRGQDRETVSLKALAYLQAATGKRPVQIDLPHSDPYPVDIRTEDDEVLELVEYMKEKISFDAELDTFLKELSSGTKDK